MLLSKNCCVDMEGVSLTPSESLVFMAIERYYQHLGRTRAAIQVEVEAHIPLARGLGSSSSVIVAGLVGANLLEGEPLDADALVQLATDIEGHPDNVVPALLGGAHLCDISLESDGSRKTRTYPLPWPGGWRVLIAVPPYRLLTETARQVLPKSFTMPDVLYNVRKASLLTYSLLKGDGDAFSQSLSDRLHQPYRGPLIPEFDVIRQAAMETGAFGAVISGAGPSVAVFYPKSIHQSLLETLKGVVASDVRLLPLEPDTQGAHAVALPA